MTQSEKPPEVKQPLEVKFRWPHAYDLWATEEAVHMIIQALLDYPFSPAQDKKAKQIIAELQGEENVR